LRVELSEVRAVAERFGVGFQEDQAARGVVSTELEEMLRELRSDGDVRSEQHRQLTVLRQRLEEDANSLAQEARQQGAALSALRSEVSGLEATVASLTARGTTRCDLVIDDAGALGIALRDGLLQQIRSELEAERDERLESLRAEFADLRASLGGAASFAIIAEAAASEAAARSAEAEAATRAASIKELREELLELTNTMEARLAVQGAPRDRDMVAVTALGSEVEVLREEVAAFAAKLDGEVLRDRQELFGELERYRSRTSELEETLQHQCEQLQAATEASGHAAALGREVQQDRDLFAERLDALEVAVSAATEAATAAAGAGDSGSIARQAIEKAAAAMDAVEAAEERLLKRHETLVVTVNKDLGFIEKRLEERGRSDCRCSGGGSISGNAAAASTAAPENTDVAVAMSLQELEMKFEAHSDVQATNLQQLGELVLGELAVLRGDIEEEGKQRVAASAQT